MYSIHSNNSCINNTPFSFILLEKGCVHNLFTHAFVVTMDKADYEEAFRAAHTLKGVCANLGFTQLFKVSSDLTEELRGGAPDEAKLPELLEKVSSEYKKTVDAINCVNE